MKNRFLNRVAIIAIAGFLFLNFYGCASQVKKTTFRGSDVLFTKNPINKIAVVGEAKVMRPRMGNNGAVLSLSASKLFVEDSVPKLKAAFEKKGYEVVFAEPAAVGYYWRGPDGYWVFDYDAKDGEPDKWRIDNLETVYEYPEIEKNPSLSTALKEEFERLNDYISVNRYLVYDPKKQNITAIAKETGADTICFARLWGKRYSAGRVAGDVALSVVAAMFGVYRTGSNVQEKRLVNIVCTDANTAQVVWQYTYVTAQDPIGNVSIKSAITEQGSDSEENENDLRSTKDDGDDAFFDRALAKLPAVNQNLSNDCRLQDKVRMILACVAKDVENQTDTASESL